MYEMCLLLTVLESAAWCLHQNASVICCTSQLWDVLDA